MARNTVPQPKKGELFHRRQAGIAAHEGKWTHCEFRHRVTLSDYLARKAAGVDIPYGCTDAAHLMGSPVDMPRVDARDLCRLPEKKLATRAAKFLTLSAEYAARKRPNPLREPIPTYADWLVRFCHLSRKEAERLAARQNADCRDLAERERQSAEIIPLPIVEEVEEIELQPLREAA